MNSDLPKVLHPVCGRPMVSHILDALQAAGVPEPVVVIGEGGDQVERALGENYIYVRQEHQLGSGHAVMCARGAAEGKARNILVMCGDSPLFRVETIRSLMRGHQREQATIALVSAVLEDPGGYGRILRDERGRIIGIVEEDLADTRQRTIKEVNGGCYAFDAEWLWGSIDTMRRNDVGEYCLTEMVDIATARGRRVAAVSAEPDEVLGVNTPAQLAAAEQIMRARGMCA